MSAEVAHAGSVIKMVREVLGWSRAQLSAVAGVDNRYLARVESGQRTPSPRWLRGVTETLGDGLAAEAMTR